MGAVGRVGAGHGQRGAKRGDDGGGGGGGDALGNGEKAARGSFWSGGPRTGGCGIEPRSIRSAPSASAGSGWQSRAPGGRRVLVQRPHCHTGAAPCDHAPL